MKKLIFTFFLMVSFYSQYSTAQVAVVQKLKAVQSFKATDSSHCDGPHGYTLCKSLTVVKGKRSCKIQLAGSSFEVEDNEEFNFSDLVKVGNSVEARAHKFSRLKIICDFDGSWKDVREVLAAYFEDPSKQMTVSGKAFNAAKRAGPVIGSRRMEGNGNPAQEKTNND